LDTGLRALSVGIELSPVFVFDVLKVCPKVGFLRHPLVLLIILLLAELLLTLQISNSLGSLLLLATQLNYTILDVRLLVILHLSNHDGIHHHVLGLLPRN